MQEFKSSFKLVISQVSAQVPPRSLTRARSLVRMQQASPAQSPPRPTLGPCAQAHPEARSLLSGEGVGEGRGKFTAGRSHGSVQGQDRLFLSCSEILPPRKTFPRRKAQTRAFPDPACPEQNHHLAPGMPGTLTGEGAMAFCSIPDVLSSSPTLSLTPSHPWAASPGNSLFFYFLAAPHSAGLWDLSSPTRG